MQIHQSEVKEVYLPLCLFPMGTRNKTTCYPTHFHFRIPDDGVPKTDGWSDEHNLKERSNKISGHRSNYQDLEIV